MRDSMIPNQKIKTSLRILILVLFGTMGVHAADYRDVRTLNLRVVPNWIDEDAFWFDRELSGGKSERVNVDARSGMMTIQADEEVDPDKDNGVVGGPVPFSGPTENESSVEFVNKTAGEVQVYWVDSTGKRNPYELLKPGQTFHQHTYAGHVWEMIGKDGSFHGSFVAKLTPAVAIIDKTFPHPEPNVKRRDPDSNEPKWISPDGKYEFGWDWTAGEDLPVYTLESSPENGGRANLKKRAYPLPGDRLDHYDLFVKDLDTGKKVEIELPLFDFGRPTFRWIDDHRLLLEKVDRGHQRFRLFDVDPTNATARTPIDESSETFIWTAHTYGVSLVTYLKNTDEVIYASERDGWRHLYLVDLNGDGPHQQITQGEWVVRDIVHVDEDQRQLHLMVSGIHADQDPYFQHLLRIDFDGTHKTVLTSADGEHSIQFSPKRQTFIDTYSRVDLPPVHELRRSADGSLIASLAKAERIAKTPLAPLLPTVFTAKGRDDKTDIWGFISFPADYDPAADRDYPVIEHIYAGPHNSHVPKKYSTLGFDNELTNLGFIVVRIDGMGTANRSKAFHDVCWQNLKDAGFPDRIAWMRSAAEQHPAMDLDRVGIFGTSAGGQNACGALLFHGDFYKAAMASCGCHDNRMDKASWNEQWMGYPVGEHYAQSSNIDHAANLDGDLLLILGELDDNVPPESTYRLVDALIKADKNFEFILIPGMGHSDGGKYGRRRMQEFFVEKLNPQHPVTETEGPMLIESEQISNLPPQTLWSEVAARYHADHASLTRRHPVSISPGHLGNLRNLLNAWTEAVSAIDIGAFSLHERNDYEDLQQAIVRDQASWQQSCETASEVQVIAPFLLDLAILCDPGQFGKPLDYQKTSENLESIYLNLKRFLSSDSLPDESVQDAAKEVADSFGSFQTFYQDYDPQFDWWVADISEKVQGVLEQFTLKTSVDANQSASATDPRGPPLMLFDGCLSDDYPNLQEQLNLSPSLMAPVLRRFLSDVDQLSLSQSHASPEAMPILQNWFRVLQDLTLDGKSWNDWSRGDQVDYWRLKREVEYWLARIKLDQDSLPLISRAGDDSGLVGNAVGKERLSLELHREFISDTPDDLIKMAERGLADCHANMTAVAQQMGCGTDWHAAVEIIKDQYSQPGQQPQLIRRLAEESTAWIERKELLTIDPLAIHSWRMMMMTPERQKVNPFFTGGEVISVSYPTRQMSLTDRTESMRGNNFPFAMATVHHELIPGHHLQGHQVDRYEVQRHGFGSPFWVEGWAVYWEYLFEDSDFVRTPDQRLGFLVWRAHRFARIIFSLRFHLSQMTPDQCVTFLVNNVGFERKNSEAEVRRSIGADYPPLYQAAYMLGAVQFQQLRGHFIADEDSRDREFHDRIMREGNLPVALIQSLLTNDSLQKDQPPSWSFR